MRQALTLLIAINLICQHVAAQSLRRPLTTAYAGTGAYSINHTDIFSMTANQASLARLEQAAAAVFGEKRFMLNELNAFNAVAGITTGSGNFGLNTAYAGFAEYNETEIGVSYARKLGDMMSIGAQFSYNGIRAATYGSAVAVGAELGVILHLSEKIHTGFHIANPVGGKFGKESQEKLASVYTAAIAYEASEKFYCSIEVIKEENQPVDVQSAMQYKFMPQLLGRAGFSAATSSAWLGAGLSFKSFRFDVTSQFHPQLGITPGLLLLFLFNKK